MAESLGVDVRRIYSVVFTLGAVLGTTAGALVVPTAAASLDMAIDFVIEAFAVVVIGGLGSMRGALFGALIVGLIRALSIVYFPELEVLSIYAIVVGVMLASAIVALPIGLLCVRYVGIFFGMLTLAFGMLFHSFLFKFYHVTGGDSGMRVPRMNILGLQFAQYNKIEFLAGPFYYYCLG